MAATRPPLAVAILLALGLAPGVARGAEVWASEDDRAALELQAYYKSGWTALVLQPGLARGTEALAGLADAAREELPSSLAARLPPVTALPRTGAVLTQAGRVWGSLRFAERYELQAGYELDSLTASDPALMTGRALGAGLAEDGRARRRLVDLDPTLASSDAARLEQNLDLLALTARTRSADLTVGRQVLSWGSGRLWNPTDLLSPFAPTDLDREVRRGVDALRVSVPLALTAQLELLYLPQPHPDEQGAVLRAQSNVGGFDLAPSVAKYVRDAVFGLDAVGDLGPVGVHAELAATVAFDRAPAGDRDRFLRTVGGIDLLPSDVVALTAEYYFNGWGAYRPTEYLEVMRSDRVARGEVFGAGRHYLGLVASYQPTNVLALQALGIINLGDPSALLVPVLEWWAEQHVLVRLGGTLPIGRRPDPGALERLTVTDLAGPSADFRAATGSLGLRSEYGASAYGLFAQVAVYPL